jgi:hypothetical protein
MECGGLDSTNTFVDKLLLFFAIGFTTVFVLLLLLLLWPGDFFFFQMGEGG